MKKVALLVHACDRYSFLYKGFEYFLSKHWDPGIHCTHYFATENTDAHIASFINIKSGKAEWSDRLALLLRKKIKEDYILYFQEDMWLNKRVNKNFFNSLFENAVTNDWKQVKLHSSEVYHTEKTNHYIEGFNISLVNNERSDYLMSHQVTLWQKDFLLAQLPSNEHPWRNEKKG